MGEFEIENGILKKYRGEDAHVIIPEHVTEIGESAFYKCENLQSIVIPHRVGKIGVKAFAGCTALTDIVLPIGLSVISWGMFRGCTSLKSIVIPEGINRIDSEAFWACESLEEISFPSSLLKIDISAFANCVSLKELTFSGRTCYIGRCAFENCVSLQKLTLPSRVGCIGGSAFKGCVSLKELTVPIGDCMIGEHAFMGCDSLNALTLQDMEFVIEDKKLIKYRCREKNAVVPDGVEIIGECAFRGNNCIAKVILPEGVKEIGEQAFAWCRYLRTITLPDSLKKIDSKAFWGCSGIKPLNDPQCAPRLDDDALGKIGWNPKLAAAIMKNLAKRSDLYSGCIVTVTNLRKHPNADRLQITTIGGSNVIVDGSCKIGQRLVCFPAGGVLDERFAIENDLLCVMVDGKKVSGGYLNPKTRLVKPVKIRGEVSDGLALPIEALSKYTDIDQLKDGDRICVLNGYRLCHPLRIPLSQFL